MKIVFVSLFVYILVILFLGVYFLKKSKKEDFLISGRKRSYLQILLSKYASSIGVSWFITYTAFAYEFGIGIFSILLGFIFGYLLFAFWAAPKIYLYSKKEKFYTIGDFVKFKTKSDFSKFVTDIVSIFYQLLLVLIGVIGGAKFISYFKIFSYEFSVFLICLVVLLYLILAGYDAVIFTDILQSFIILFLLGICSFSCFYNVDFSNLILVNKNVSFGTIFSFFVWGTVSGFASSDRFQLCYSSKNIKEVKKGMALAIVPILITATFLLFIGLIVLSNNSNLDPSIVFLEAMSFYLPKEFLFLSFILFFAGLMSSIDTGVFAISSHLVFLKKSKKPIKYIRIVTFLVIVFVMLFALFFKDIVDITVIAAGFILSLSVPLIYLFFNGKSSSCFLFSIFCALIGMVVGFGLKGLNPICAIFVLSFGILGIVFFKFYIFLKKSFNLF